MSSPKFTEQETIVSFAGSIVETALDNDLTPTIIFNGIAAAVAALIVDYIMDDEGLVDDMSLKYAVTNFKAGVDKAVDFAMKEVKRIDSNQHQLTLAELTLEENSQ